jgi:glycerol-3-phosphate acyltransferase PlsY
MDCGLARRAPRNDEKVSMPLALPPPLALAIALAFGYLCGSIPFGFIFMRLSGGPDIRSIGSGNIGATNVLRTGSKKLAAATLLGDMLKGTVAIALTNWVFEGDAALAAALGAFLGHLFPVWLGFKGGKGVATFIGLLLGFGAWIALIAFCTIWLLVAFASRYSSLAALIASAASPAVLYWRGDTRLAALFVALGALLWIMHRGNIARLLNGTESKIGRRVEAARNG